MDGKRVFRAAALAAIVAFFAVLVMGFGVQIPEAGVELQPSLSFGTAQDFVYPTNTYPELALRFFAADSLFILSYLMVFVGLFTLVKPRSLPFAAIGLGAGILTALFDAAENAFFITYAASALNGVLVSDPAIPLIYILANLKWMSAFATLYAFGLVWPRENLLEWFLSGLMLLFPLVGVLGVSTPDLVPLRGLFFLFGMPLFALFFWRKSRA